jgi:selenocysteine lyase/cysteine desulfurase
MGYDASIRVSFGVYNNQKDVDMLIQALEELFKSNLL